MRRHAHRANAILRRRWASQMKLNLYALRQNATYAPRTKRAPTQYCPFYADLFFCCFVHFAFSMHRENHFEIIIIIIYFNILKMWPRGAHNANTYEQILLATSIKIPDPEGFLNRPGHHSALLIWKTHFWPKNLVFRQPFFPRKIYIYNYIPARPTSYRSMGPTNSGIKDFRIWFLK